MLKINYFKLIGLFLILLAITLNPFFLSIFTLDGSIDGNIYIIIIIIIEISLATLGLLLYRHYNWIIKKRKELLMLFISILFSFIILEIASYNILPEINSTHLYEDLTKYRQVPSHIREDIVHPYIGFVRNPTVNSYFNSYGFPGHEPVFNKSENDFIIGVFGGSVAQIFYSVSIEKLRNNLKKKKYFKDKNITFLSFANGGLKQPQQLMALNYFLILGIDFDMVINIDGFNEIVLPYAENLENNVALSFPRLWDLRLIKSNNNPRKNYLLNDIIKLKNTRSQWANILSNFFIKHDFISKLANTIINNYLVNQINIKGAMLKEISTSEDFQSSGKVNAYNNENEIFESIIDIWKRSSKQMSKICRANDIKYYQFIQPNQYHLNSKTLSKKELRTAFFDGDYKFAIINMYPSLIKEGENLKKENINLFDATMVFKNISETLYIDTCCHFNEKGNDIFADFIAKSIIDTYDNASIIS